MDNQKKYKWLKRVMIGVPLLLACAYIGARLYVDYRIQQESDLIREAGYPLTLEELDAWYAPEPGKVNRTLELEAALETLDRESNITPEQWGEFFETIAFSDTPEKLRLELAQYLDRNESTLKYIGSLLGEGETWRYSLDTMEGARAPLTHLGRMRSAARLFSVQAKILADNGNIEEAFSSLEHCFSLGESLRDEPLLLSQLVRIQITTIWFYGMKTALDAAGFGEVNTDHWQRMILEARTSTYFAKGLIGDRAMLVSVLKDVANGVRSESDWYEYLNGVGPVSGPWLYGTYFDFEVFVLMRGFREISDIALIEEPERYRLAKAWDAQWDEENDFGRMSATKLFPSFINALEAENRGRAFLAVAESAMIVLESGTISANMVDIEELRRRFPADPFDGEPIRCRVDGDSVYLYSIAHDREDDEGRPPADGLKITEDGDISIRIPR